MVYISNSQQEPEEDKPVRVVNGAHIQMPVFFRWALVGAATAVVLVFFGMQWGWGIIDNLLGLV